ncbi:MAG TPA: DUF2059 domain-containing protein [Edaphobacter sp.]|nr:DUF2059 domain-containing protein [Edaphobacter sp.]
MKLKSSLLALILLLVAPILASAQTTSPAAPTESIATLAPPEHPATPEQIREYLSLTKFVENAHKAMTQMLRTTRATSAPYYTASFWDDMNTAILEIDLVTPNIPAFQKYFSQEDMAATIAFYKTPSGQRLLAAQPFIASAAGDILRDAGRTVGMQVALKHKDEIEALTKKSQPATPATTPPDKSSPQPK